MLPGLMGILGAPWTYGNYLCSLDLWELSVLPGLVALCTLNTCDSSVLPGFSKLLCTPWIL